MTVLKLSAALVAAAAGLYAPTSMAQPAKAVLELFTSQGCSSCPPADRLFASIADRDDLIALTLPVDYWDGLGWKDTLASPAFTARQRGYSLNRGDGEVYTPQAVVNGATHFVGNRRSGVDEAIDAPSSLAVGLDLQHTAEGIHVSIGATSAGVPTSALILALPIVSERNVTIGRGENANTQVTYTNVVRGIEAVGMWSGKPVQLTLADTRYQHFDSLVVLVQTGTVQRPGPIIGAARLRIR